MSEVRDLVQSLSPDTINNLFAQSRMFAEKPTPRQKWHVSLSSPLIGQQTYAFDNFEDLRRELTKVAGKLTLGSLHVFYGYELPVTTDASGHNMFVVNLEGEEVPITDGWDVRKPLNDNKFGPQTKKIELEKIV